MTETADLERARDAVRSAVLSGIVRRRRTRRARAFVVATGSALALAAGAAIGATGFTPADQGLIDSMVVCYQQDDLHSRQQYVSGAVDDSGVMQVEGGCELVWSEDMWKYPDGPPEGHHPFPVPRIAACLDPQGIGAGFPLWDDSETPQQMCERLGLPFWDGSLQLGSGQP